MSPMVHNCFFKSNPKFATQIPDYVRRPRESSSLARIKKQSRQPKGYLLYLVRVARLARLCLARICCANHPIICPSRLRQGEPTRYGRRVQVSPKNYLKTKKYKIAKAILYFWSEWRDLQGYALQEFAAQIIPLYVPRVSAKANRRDMDEEFKSRSNKKTKQTA